MRQGTVMVRRWWHAQGVTGLRIMLMMAVIAITWPAPVAASNLPNGFTETLVTATIDDPTALALMPDGRILVAEQSGALRVVKNGVLLAQPFVSLNVDDRGERGLIGVTVDPNVAANGHIYVYYTVPSSPPHNRVSRFTASGDVAAPNSETILIELDNLSAATNHNGGAIHFGLDGKLYIGVGDNANGANAQSLNTVLGKMLRINADGGIPTDNPFYSTTTGKNRAIWALGLRNPYTFAVQPGTGRIFINDVGSSGAAVREEINDGIAGSNYGWPIVEGIVNNPSYRDPVYAYEHTGGACAITGGAFYNPVVTQFPAEYVGDYLFSDLCAGWIKRYDTTTGAVTDLVTGNAGFVPDIAVGADGSLYYISLSMGTLYRVDYTGNAPIVGATSWYFAEGFTGTGFDEYLSILNANSQAANVRITYYLASGGPITKELVAGASRRTTVAVHDPTLGVGRDQAVAARVESTNGVGIIVERPMYFRYQTSRGNIVTGGHTVLGATSPRSTWYFAEGFTGNDFDEYLTILNPNAGPAQVTISYALPSGPVSPPTVVNVPGQRRATVAVHDTVQGVGRDQAVAVTVTTGGSTPIVVERPMYFVYHGSINGGHNTIGAPEGRTRWYFAEGFTGAGFDEYLTILNPQSETATVTLTYFLPGGALPPKVVTVPANSRETIIVHEATQGVGRDQAVSVLAESNRPVVVERPMYFTYPGGRDGGHIAVGAAGPRPAWYFAEGFTGAGFDEYLTILNPNPRVVEVAVTYYLTSGTLQTKALSLPANSRSTVSVHDSVQGVGRNQAVAARVVTNDPDGIIVERPMYFSYSPSGGGGAVTGGHVVVGFAP